MKMSSKEVTKQIGQDAEYCPNCAQHGSHDLTRGEDPGTWEEWRCDNDNCRVLVYFVGKERDQHA